MLVIPWQAIAAVERNLTHILGSSNAHPMELVVKHIAQHDGHVLHHHDDDDGDDGDNNGTHVDSSHKSFQHLTDYEQGCNMNILLAALNEPGLHPMVRVAPILRSDVFSNRTTPPLLRPPRLPA